MARYPRVFSCSHAAKLQSVPFESAGFPRAVGLMRKKAMLVIIRPACALAAGHLEHNVAPTFVVAQLTITDG